MMYNAWDAVCGIAAVCSILQGYWIGFVLGAGRVMSLFLSLWSSYLILKDYDIHHWQFLVVYFILFSFLWSLMMWIVGKAAWMILTSPVRIVDQIAGAAFGVIAGVVNVMFIMFFIDYMKFNVPMIAESASYKYIQSFSKSMAQSNIDMVKFFFSGEMGKFFQDRMR